MKLVLLPGLDGTGLMFSPFLKYLSTDLEVKVIPLEQNDKIGYFEQTEIIASKLDNEEVILLSESYSGRLAYELCLRENIKIKHVIFIASFLSKPSLASRFASFLPLGLIKKQLIPDYLIKNILFSKNVSNELLDLFYKAISEVDSTVLTKRLKNIEQLTAPKNVVDIASTYIQASNDSLVHRNAVEVFKHIFTNLNIENLEGGHFLLQTNPENCWNVVKRIIN